MKYKTWEELHQECVACYDRVLELAKEEQRKTHGKDLKKEYRKALYFLNNERIRLNTGRIREQTIGR